jgi:nucleoid DNA-binding protein
VEKCLIFNIYYRRVISEMIDKKKRDVCKELAKRTRGWVDSKSWMKLLKILREVIADLTADGYKIGTPLGNFEAKVSKQRKVTDLHTKQKIDVGGGKRLKLSPAPYFKEKLNAERDK